MSKIAIFKLKSLLAWSDRLGLDEKQEIKSVISLLQKDIDNQNMQIKPKQQIKKIEKIDFVLTEKQLNELTRDCDKYHEEKDGY